MIEMHPIRCEPPLVLHHSPGSTPRLVVCFAGVGTNRRIAPPVEFARIAHQQGENHVLHVSDASRSWMNGPAVAAPIVAAVQTLAEQIGATEISAIGNSMGGTAAMILAALMPIGKVVAVVPQFSVHPEILPEETHWHHFRDRIADWPFAQVPDLRATDTVVTLLHGGSPDELAHALRFPADAGYRHFIFPRHGHKLASDLHAADQLAPIITLALQGRDFRARKAVRAAGGVSRSRFDRLSEFPLSEEAT